MKSKFKFGEARGQGEYWLVYLIEGKTRELSILPELARIFARGIFVIKRDGGRCPNLLFKCNR